MGIFPGQTNPLRHAARRTYVLAYVHTRAGFGSGKSAPAAFGDLVAGEWLSHDARTLPPPQVLHLVLWPKMELAQHCSTKKNPSRINVPIYILASQ